MKNVKTLYSLLILATAILFYGCGENPVEGMDDRYVPVNQWISANMDFYYFWSEEMPKERTFTVTPEVFYELLLHPRDNFSDIYEDSSEVLDQLDGKSYSAGFSPYFGQFFNSNQVFIVVELVYPGTPADSAGLKRGDIILRINQQTLSVSNYRFLYNAANMNSVTLGEYNESSNQIVATDSVVEVHTRELSVNPVYFSEVYEMNNEKIGYLVYNEFINGEDKEYLQALEDSLAALKSQGITELIVDLRYNRGGVIQPAEALANAIVPSQHTTNEDVFVSYQYNDSLQNYFVNQQGPDSENLNTRFSESSNNFGLERVFFMTTQNTASASELLINGLRPYMDVVMIGEPTFGKYYGSTVIYDRDQSSNHSYAITPVYTKYANANGVTDFATGLQPDHPIDDFILNPVPFGDTSDPIMAKAIEIITGSAQPAKRIPAFFYKELYDPVRMKKGNILFTGNSVQ